jgi:hypothetical protein
VVERKRVRDRHHDHGPRDVGVDETGVEPAKRRRPVEFDAVLGRLHEHRRSGPALVGVNRH